MVISLNIIVFFNFSSPIIAVIEFIPQSLTTNNVGRRYIVHAFHIAKSILFWSTNTVVESIWLSTGIWHYLYSSVSVCAKAVYWSDQVQWYLLFSSLLQPSAHCWVGDVYLTPLPAEVGLLYYRQVNNAEWQAGSSSEFCMIAHLAVWTHFIVAAQLWHPLSVWLVVVSAWLSVLRPLVMHLSHHTVHVWDLSFMSTLLCISLCSTVTIVSIRVTGVPNCIIWAYNTPQASWW